MQDRLNSARTSVRRTIREWTSVRLIDDSRFCLDFTVKRQLVLKMSKENLMNVKKIYNRYYNGSAMMWAGISVKGKTDLYIVENGR